MTHQASSLEPHPIEPHQHQPFLSFPQPACYPADAMERQTSLSPKAHLESHDKPYVPHDVIDETTKAGVTGLLIGSFAGGVRNAMSRQNLGFSGYFIRQAPLIGVVSTSIPLVMRTQLHPIDWLRGIC